MDKNTIILNKYDDKFGKICNRINTDKSSLAQL